MPSACFQCVDTLLYASKHAEGMTLRYGGAIFGAYARGLEKRGAPPCVGVRLGMGGDVLLIFDIFCAVLRAGCSSSVRRWSLDLRRPELG